MTTELDKNSQIAAACWQSTSALMTAHVIALGSTEMTPGEAIEDLLDTIETVRSGGGPASTLRETIQTFRRRVENQVPGSASGLTAIGRGTGESVAALARLLVRPKLLSLCQSLVDLREMLIQFAESHVVSSMAAAIHGQPASPTSLGHWLGGAISPLARATQSVFQAIALTNMSPLGAGSLASCRLSVDRREAANLLAFDDVLLNTFDAVNAIDYFQAVANALELAVFPSRRLLDEFETWLRIDPTVLVFDESLLERFDDLPQMRLPAPIAAAKQEVNAVLEHVLLLRNWATRIDYGPQVFLDLPVQLIVTGVDSTTNSNESMQHLLNSEISLNRASLANRAGKGYVTSSDLADFLMLEEQIAPADAQLIASRALAGIKDRGQEISALDKDAIDSAALLVIGREVGVEIEVISRYLAPRRVLESRTASGAPSPGSTRAWLASEKKQVSADQEQKDSIEQRIERALTSLDEVRSQAGNARSLRGN